MHMSITVRSWWLLFATIILAIGTAYFVVFDDLRHGGQMTAEHVLYLLVFLATLLSGLLAWPLFKAWHVFPAIVLGIASVVGTAFVAVESAGRAAKAGFITHAEANQAATSHKDAVAELERTRKARAKATDDYLSQCATGNGLRCKGLREALDAVERQYYTAEARLDKAKPSAPASGSAYIVGQIAGTLGFPAPRIEEAYRLLKPVSLAVLLDVVVLFLLHVSIAIGWTRTPKETPAAADGGERKLLTFDPVVEVLEKAGRPLSNQELAEALKVSKGQASKLVSRSASFRKERAGREVRISLAQH